MGIEGGNSGNNILERFGFRRHKEVEHSPYAPREIPFVNGELMLTQNDLDPNGDTSDRGTLPFGIKVEYLGEKGYKFTRMGPPFTEDTGHRVFIVDSQALEDFYSTNPTSDQLYDNFLKMHDQRIRLFASANNRVKDPHEDVRGNSPDEDDCHEYYRPEQRLTVISKLVDAEKNGEKRNRYNVPDLGRWEITAQGAREVITERVYIWKDRDGSPIGQLNLSLLLRDVPQVRLVEPPDRVDRNGPDLDRKIFSQPQTNTVVIAHLRNKLVTKVISGREGDLPVVVTDGGSIPNQFEAYIRKTDWGTGFILSMEQPTYATHSTLGGFGDPNDKNEIERYFSSYLGEEDGKVLILPLELGRVTFYDNYRRQTRRRLATIDILEDPRVKTGLRLRFVNGIEPGTWVGEGRSHIFAFESSIQLGKEREAERRKEEALRVKYKQEIENKKKEPSTHRNKFFVE